MYEKDGEKYFVVDSHMHYWNAAPDNWVKGAEQYAKGWIECFHAYQGLGPPETHWSIEHFQKYSEDDLMKDVFEDGYVDVAVFQPTYLKEWYKEGFNTTERNAALGEEPGFYDSAEFEENMSTHYGRMIHEDDRTIMFANPEDAAEYIGFDLTDLTPTS